MKILELCPYSSGACGVWARVRQESKELIKKGHEVKVFSSYFEKGTDKKMLLEEFFEGISIKRFKAKKLGGESFMTWDFIKEGLEYSPEVIIVHNYRHLHTTKAIKLRDKLVSLGKTPKLFLVTHAPFVEGNITRSKLATFIVNFYDSFFGPKTLKKFDKILTISKWEVPYLLKVGAPKNKIVYLPNGIPKEVFIQKKKNTSEKGVLFLGRVSPIKNLQTFVLAAKNFPKIKFSIVGPEEKVYLDYLKQIISQEKISNVSFYPPVYELEKKIELIDKNSIFILPSKREGMPQALIEAMSRGKVVIGSNIIAIRDLISDKKNGLLFEFDKPLDLAKKIDFVLDKKNSKKILEIQKNARKSVEKFNWDILIQKLVSLF